MSVIMEDTSRGWGPPTGYRELTPAQKRRARRDFLQFQKEYGFVETDK